MVADATSNYTIVTTAATCVLAIASIVAGVFAYRTWKAQKAGTESQVEVATKTAPVLDAQLPAFEAQAVVLEQQLPVLKEQLEAARQASRDRRRAQAVRLVAWVTYTSEPAVASTVHEGLWPRIMVVNHADSPAVQRDARLGCHISRNPPKRAEVTEVDRSTDIRLIAPGATLERDMPDLDALRPFSRAVRLRRDDRRLRRVR